MRVRAGAVALATLAWVWLVYARQYVLNADEGIIAETAMRVLRGEVPYRDFFLHFGPLSSWMLAGVLAALGTTLEATRAVTALAIAVMSGCVYLCAARFARASIAALVTFGFVVLITAQESLIIAQHRWDSAAFATAAAACGVACLLRPGFAAAFAAGALAALAAWCTPSVALVIPVLAVFVRPWRAVLAGVATVSACMLTALGLYGALPAFLDCMLWNPSHYAGANIVPYGFVRGGYARLFEGQSGFALLMSGVVALGLLVPAVLPFVTAARALSGYGGDMRRSALLLVCVSVALIASAYPRWDQSHLTYIMGPSFILFAWMLEELARAGRTRIAAAALLIVLMPANLFLLYRAMSFTQSQTIGTRVGQVRGTPDMLSTLSLLERHVPESQTLFAYPVYPAAFLYTRTVNPTRYFLLQPGMMSDADERTTLDALRRRPPRFICRMETSDDAYLALWPGTDPRRLRFPAIDAWVDANYTRAAFDPQTRVAIYTAAVR